LVVKTNLNHTSQDNLKEINPTGVLVLEDGSFFKGHGFGLKVQQPEKFVSTLL